MVDRCKKKSQVANIYISIATRVTATCSSCYGGWFIEELDCSLSTIQTSNWCIQSPQQANGLPLTNPDKIANMKSWLNQDSEMAVLNSQHLKGWNVREWRYTIDRRLQFHKKSAWTQVSSVELDIFID